MNHLINAAILLAVTGAWSVSRAGKIESVQIAIKKACSKDLASDEALRLVKDLYLSCVPNTKVEIDDTCKVSCLKENAGTVVGQ